MKAAGSFIIHRQKRQSTPASPPCRPRAAINRHQKKRDPEQFRGAKRGIVGTVQGLEYVAQSGFRDGLPSPEPPCRPFPGAQWPGFFRSIRTRLVPPLRLAEEEFGNPLLRTEADRGFELPQQSESRIRIEGGADPGIRSLSKKSQQQTGFTGTGISTSQFSYPAQRAAQRSVQGSSPADFERQIDLDGSIQVRLRPCVRPAPIRKLRSKKDTNGRINLVFQKTLGKPPGQNESSNK